MDVSIIIVSYNADKLLDNCLASIKQWTQEIDYEIIVVENFHSALSTQPLCEQHQDINWVFSGYNAGFGRANNLGVKQAKGEYILYLNPDTQFEENVVLKLFQFYQKKEKEINIGALTCKIINLQDGTLLIGSGNKFQSMWDELRANPFVIKFQKTFGIQGAAKYNPQMAHHTNHSVDFVSGACLFVSKEKTVQYQLGFDEDFFLYYEDVELCYRMSQLGLQNYFTSETSILHVNSGSTSKIAKLDFQILLSKWLFFRKTTNPLVFTFYSLLVQFNDRLNFYLAKRSKQSNSEELKETLHLGNSYLKKIKTFAFRSENPHKFLKLTHELD